MKVRLLFVAQWILVPNVFVAQWILVKSDQIEIFRSLYFSLKSWLCCCSLASLVPQQIYTFKFLLSTCSHLRALQKKYENPYLLYRRFKGGDDTFDTKTHTFAITVSNFSPWVINLLFRIVESGSSLSNKFWLCCSVITHNLSRIKFAHISR